MLKIAVILRSVATKDRYPGEAVAVALTMCWFLAACADASAPATPPVTVGPPARLDPITVPLSALVFTDLPILARVSDSAGHHVARATVTWSVVSGGGSLTPVTVVSDDSGVVTTTYHLSQTAGQPRVRGTLATGATHDFDITARPGPLTELLPDYIDLSLRVGSPFSGTVKAVDTYGNPVPGIGLTARAGTIEATLLPTQPLSPPTQITDANGNATFSGTAGALPGLQSFSVDGPNGFVFPGPITAVFRVRGFGDQGYMAPALGESNLTLFASSGGTRTIGVVVIRADGMYAASVPVTFTLSPGNGSLQPPAGGGTSSSSYTGLTDTYSGFASVVWRPPLTPGIYTLTASTPPPNDGGSPLTFTLKVVP